MEQIRKNEILDRGLEMAGLKAGSRILDIGCGDGWAVAHMANDLGMKAEGIDINVAKIAEAKEKYPGIEVRFADGEFLEDYMSFTFDGINMGNCLRSINMPDEALHEAYCVLKKGGKLIINDIYEQDPDEDQVRAVKIEADRLAKIPHQEGDCENLGPKFVDFRFEGAFYREPLIAQLEEIGFNVLAFEDVDVNDETAGLEETAGSEAGSAGEKATQRDRKLGSFLLVAAKPL